MTTKIKIIPAREFIEITTHGVININNSRKLFTEIAKAKHHQADCELLVDFRDTQLELSTADVYELASELHQHGNTFLRKVALVVNPGHNFDHASFFETCSHNRGFSSINAFANYETAIRWILKAET